MSTPPHIRSILVGMAAAVLCTALLTPQAHADNEADGQASIEISMNLEIFEQKALDFGDAGVTLQSLDIEGDGSIHQLNLDANGEAQVGLGGDVTVTDAAAVGTYTADITLTANYE